MAAESSTTVEFPRGLQNRVEADRFVRERYGAEVAQALQKSLEEQKSAVDELHTLGLNGEAQGLEEEYRTHLEQYQSRDSLLGSVWKGITAPFRMVGKVIADHPILSSAALLALLYFTNLGTSVVALLQAVASRLPDGALKEFAGRVISLGTTAPKTVGGLNPGMGLPPASEVPMA